MLLILLLGPQAGFLAVSTPVTDRRTGLLVTGLLVVLLAAPVTPAVSDHLGLTGPARGVCTIVLPVLVVRFLALRAAYRFQVPVDGQPTTRPFSAQQDRSGEAPATARSASPSSSAAAEHPTVSVHRPTRVDVGDHICACRVVAVEPRASPGGRPHGEHRADEEEPTHEEHRREHGRSVGPSAA